jgi:hypothetical protein
VRADTPPPNPLPQGKGENVVLAQAVPYPERHTRPPGLVEEYLRGAGALLPRPPQAQQRLGAARVARLADTHTQEAASWADAPEAAATALRARLRAGIIPALAARSFALIRAVATRLLGLTPYEVQLMAAWAMLRGRMTEPATGEGKTLAASLTAATAALAGRMVHVVTVNDYLAGRDHALLSPLYRALGLTAGLVVHGQTPAQRRAAYACDIVYASNKELVFDYLRDQMRRRATPSTLHGRVARLDGRRAHEDALVLRGLDFAIVDEADSVLINETRTPLIISETVNAESEDRACAEALDLVADLVEGADYRIDRSERRIDLTPAGQVRVEALSATLARPRRAREPLSQTEDFSTWTLRALLPIFALLAAAPARAQSDSAAGTCIIKPHVTVQFGSAVNGLLSALLVDRGDTVTQGQVVAQLESSVEQATLALDQMRASNDSAVKAEQADMELSEREAERKKFLVEQKIANLNSLDELQTKVREGELRVQQAQMDQRLADPTAQRSARAGPQADTQSDRRGRDRPEAVRRRIHLRADLHHDDRAGRSARRRGGPAAAALWQHQARIDGDRAPGGAGRRDLYGEGRRGRSGDRRGERYVRGPAGPAQSRPRNPRRHPLHGGVVRREAGNAMNRVRNGPDGRAVMLRWLAAIRSYHPAKPPWGARV